MKENNTPHPMRASLSRGEELGKLYEKEIFNFLSH
jgi:hypothetical protein